jgi:hypothetical protein
MRGWEQRASIIRVGGETGKVSAIQADRGLTTLTFIFLDAYTSSRSAPSIGDAAAREDVIERMGYEGVREEG